VAANNDPTLILAQSR